ncbi:MAG TPA: 3-hydroxyacyl-CoA dehydrogenase NAD-binding domain-containing protein [Burkholderiales bacterium]|nr:3-hydroxyacyl-CoA dehydrogenase NAD-binding domain-containing protein [Burkholderiales bacterium]
MSLNSRTVAVIGGGTMGADIAATFAAHGWTAHIVNPHDRMRESLEVRLQAAMEKLGAPYDAASFPLHETVDSIPWEDVAIAIEAVSERLELKRQIFEDMMKLSRPGTPLCSNSTAIPISRIAENLPTRDRMLGTHYFMPAHLVPAVEVVSSKDTRKAVADRVVEILKSVGKVPVRVGLDIPGFLGARLQAALSREAIDLVNRGIATPEDIDNIVRYGFGFRYLAAGPLLQRDHAGVDVHCAGAETIYPDLCNASEPSPYMSDKVKAGHIGMKAKKGFYDWTDESIAVEKERYERALLASLAILNDD